MAPQTKGIALLLLALMMFALMDAAAKTLGARYHTGQVVWARFAVNAVVLALIFRTRLPRLIKSRQPGMQFWRALTQILTVTLFFLSIRYIGLAEAAALTDVNPVLITLGAALFLGERLGPRRLAGIAVAFCGAMIILRPGAGVMHPAALLALAAAFTYSAGALLTRALRGDSVATSMLWSALVGTAICSLALPFLWQPIAAADLWLFIGMGLLGTAAQGLLIRAFSIAEAGALAPFGYMGLVFSSLWGFLFFGQLPDRWTVLGAVVIVAAGLYVWQREAQLARAKARAER
ncbi:MAG: EamA/RhaT family transporter [Alphaproteobacteria bacterium HGW-Alphaproteobacteria-4]|jgi:drug/metabolite transporter (DMT)-like permease|nr:MAG: EamA/RhaT family transporter [Alphaproteobacteria bacterium HGW-Alphaproteobacteria-4]